MHSTRRNEHAGILPPSFGRTQEVSIPRAILRTGLMHWKGTETED